MPIQGDLPIYGAVEGVLDEAVLRSLVAEIGLNPCIVHVKDGKANLRQRIDAYNNAAKRNPWIVLVDLDRDADCAPPLKREWLPQPAGNMCFRIAVREIEAWLLADRRNLARFLGISINRITSTPEKLNDPKRMMVELAGSSRKREIRLDMVPPPGSGREVGPAYDSRLIEFACTAWNPGEASVTSNSLDRCRARLRQLMSAGQ